LNVLFFAPNIGNMHLPVLLLFRFTRTSFHDSRFVKLHATTSPLAIYGHNVCDTAGKFGEYSSPKPRIQLPLVFERIKKQDKLKLYDKAISLQPFNQKTVSESIDFIIDPTCKDT